VTVKQVRGCYECIGYNQRRGGLVPVTVVKKDLVQAAKVNRWPKVGRYKYGRALT